MLKRSPSTRDVLTVSALVTLGILLTAGLIALNWWLGAQFGTGEELLPAWNGTRVFLFEGADPYSQTVAEQTQIEVYGRAAREGEYPYALDIPFPLLIVYLLPLFLYRFLQIVFELASLGALPNPDASWFPWAYAIWMTISEVGLVMLVLLANTMTEWQAKPWFRALLLAVSLGSFYSVHALLGGSFSILAGLALVGALFLLRNQNDEAAGMLLAVASFRWEVGVLLFVFLVIGSYLSRRWYVFAGYGLAAVVLGGVGYLLYPGWGWPYLRSVAANIRAEEGHTLARTLSAWLPDAGDRLAFVIIPLLLLILVLEWFAALRTNNFRRITWVAALSLAITPLAGLTTTLSNLAPLIFSFAVVLPFAWERWEKRPYLILVGICVIFFLAPIAIRLRVEDIFLANALLYLLIPFINVLGLYWIRWYAVRPPRTWLESARREIQK